MFARLHLFYSAINGLVFKRTNYFQENKDAEIYINLLFSIHPIRTFEYILVPLNFLLFYKYIIPQVTTEEDPKYIFYITSLV